MALLVVLLPELDVSIEINLQWILSQFGCQYCQSHHQCDRWWSLETRVLSQDVVFHFSVLAQSRHLYVLSWLCLKFPCLIMSHDSALIVSLSGIAMCLLWSPYVIGLTIIFMAALCNRGGHYIFALWLWSPYVIGQTIIFSSCSFFLLSIFFFPRLISAVGDWMFTILWHMVWP